MQLQHLVIVRCEISVISFWCLTWQWWAIYLTIAPVHFYII
jgi:hypothetical protein